MATDSVLPVYAVHAGQVSHSGSGVFTDLYQSFDWLPRAVLAQEIQQRTTLIHANRQTDRRPDGQIDRDQTCQEGRGE